MWVLTPNVITATAPISSHFVLQWGVVADRTTDSTHKTPKKEIRNIILDVGEGE